MRREGGRREKGKTRQDRGGEGKKGVRGGGVEGVERGLGSRWVRDERYSLRGATMEATLLRSKISWLSFEKTTHTRRATALGSG